MGGLATFFPRDITGNIGGSTMPLFTRPLADHCLGRYGVVGDDELRALGISKARSHALVDAEILVPVHRGVHRLASTPITLEGRCLAVCLASDAVVTGAAAGKLWGVRRVPPPDRIEVRLPWYSNTFRSPDVLIRRCPPLPLVDITEREDGIRVVAPPRLVFDLSALLSDLDLESVIEQVLDKKWCTVETINDTVSRLFHPSRPGARRAARVLGLRADGFSGTADSHLEVVLFDALRAAGIDGLDRQFEVALPAGFSIHADIAVPALQWLIPIDHVDWHGGRVASQRDKRADRQARMDGWHVDRVCDDDIRERLDDVVTELVAIHARLAHRRPRMS